MKLELINLGFSSDIQAPTIQAEFSEGIHKICTSDLQIRHQLFSYLTAQAIPPRGAVHFLGYDIHHLGNAYRNHLSYYTQYPFPSETISLSNYLTENAISQRLPLPDAKKKAAFILREMGIQGRWYSHLSQVSPKLRHRIHLYQTVLSEAPIIILNEDELPIPGTPDCDYVREQIRLLSETKIILLLADKPIQRVIQIDPFTTLREDPFPDLPKNMYILPF